MGGGAWAQYLSAFVLGGLFGTAELVSRYRDNQRRLFKMLSTWLYIVTNGLISTGALFAAVEFKVDFGMSDPGRVDVARVAVSGVGAMLLLRSAFAELRLGGRDIAAGPALLVKAILESIDRIIDRNQARYRSVDVRTIMGEVSFEKAYEALPAHCILLLQTTTDEEASALAKAVAEIKQRENSTDRVKSCDLGVALVKFAGAEVLRDAVATLGDDIKLRPRSDDPVEPADQSVPPHDWG